MTLAEPLATTPAAPSAASRMDTPDRKWSWWLFIGSVLIGFAGFIAVWELRSVGALQPAELWAYDALLRWQPRDLRCKDKILIVRIEESDLGKYHYPIPDGILAKAIANLMDPDGTGQFAAAAVAVDVIRDNPVGDAQGTAELSRVLKKYGKIFWAFMPPGDDAEMVKTPQDVPPQRAGFVYFPVGEDGTVRRALIAAGMGGQTYNSLAFLAVKSTFQAAISEQAAKANPKQPGEDDRQYATRLRQKIFPKGPDGPWVFGSHTYDKFNLGDGPFVTSPDLNAGGGFQLCLDFRGPMHFDSIDLQRIVENRFEPEKIKGRVVLIGMEAKTVKDYETTPLDVRKPGVHPTWGLELHATVADNLLRYALFHVPPITFWSRAASSWYTLGWAALGVVAGLVSRIWFRWGLITVLGNAVILVCAFFPFWGRWVWIPVIPPLICWNFSCVGVMLLKLQNDRRARAAVQQVIDRTIPKSINRLLWGQRNQLVKSGTIQSHSGDATILFSDIEGFSRISREMKGNESALIAWLNDYLQAMSKVIQSPNYNGLVLSYMGDGIMAVFGPPEFADPAAAARHAIECALKMRETLADVRRKWPLDSARHMRIRIGIYTGKVIDGLLGGGGRLDYSVIGDSVNAAARIESWDKKMMTDDLAPHRCRIVVSESTLKLAGDRFTVKDLGEQDLPGPGRVRLFAVID